MRKRLLFLWFGLTFSFVLPLTAAETVAEHLVQGSRLIREKKYEEAVQEYDQILRMEPKNLRALLVLGLTYAQIGKFDRAVEFTKKASELDPAGYVPYYNLGLIYASNQELDKALDALNQALKINPESYVAEYQRGLVYSAQGAHDKAAESYKRVLELNPYFEKARIALAGASYRQGDKVAALEHVEELRKMHKETLAQALEQWMEREES